VFSQLAVKGLKMIFNSSMVRINHGYFAFVQKVTKGARHKIVLSINKLRERQQSLRDFEKVGV
jgi:hypothetical protein